MSVSYIPAKVKYNLWGKSAGRCQYRGCNKPLYLDSLTKSEFNISYIAHIIADKPNGPRGDEVLSPLLGSDISNLMLLCDVHHRMVDINDVEGHTVELLKGMKLEHEERIELLSQMETDRQSYVVLFGANIGDNRSPLNMREIHPALKKEVRYPAQLHPITLSLENSLFKDEDEFYWKVELRNLRDQFKDKIKNGLGSYSNHYSLFALAPQPLLIELGRLFSDITTVSTHQRQREPEQTWEWANDNKTDYIVYEPKERFKNIALNLSLSATINKERILNTLGEDTSIWSITIDSPNNDFLKSKTQLSDFRRILRSLLDKIKAYHGQDAKIHVFQIGRAHV